VGSRPGRWPVACWGAGLGQECYSGPWVRCRTLGGAPGPRPAPPGRVPRVAPEWVPPPGRRPRHSPRPGGVAATGDRLVRSPGADSGVGRVVESRGHDALAGSSERAAGAQEARVLRPPQAALAAPSTRASAAAGAATATTGRSSAARATAATATSGTASSAPEAARCRRLTSPFVGR